MRRTLKALRMRKNREPDAGSEDIEQDESLQDFLINKSQSLQVMNSCKMFGQKCCKRPISAGEKSTSGSDQKDNDVIMDVVAQNVHVCQKKSLVGDQ